MHAAAPLMIMGLGLVAFVFDTIGGVLFAKLMNLFLPKGKKINPMVGRRRHFGLPHVRPGHPENGPQGGQPEPPADARRGRQCGRADRLRGGRRHHPDSWFPA